MLENVTFFRQKGENLLTIDIVSGGGENLLCVPTFLSGIVGFLSTV